MFKQAIKQLKYVSTIESVNKGALYNLGLATYMQTEDTETAIQYFEHAVSINPEHLMSNTLSKHLNLSQRRSNSMDNPTLFNNSMIKGTVDAILFQNKDNFYTVLKVDTIESNETFDSMPTVVGFFPEIAEGDVYTFKGQVVSHPKYGKQLKAETFEKELPQTKEAIVSYLSSDLYKDIGKKTAQNIVNALGENTISDILNDPSVVEKVPSLPKKKQKQIAEQISSNQETEQIIIRLHDLGFGPKLAMAIYQVYLGDTLNV